MPQTIHDVMTPRPVALSRTSSVQEAARTMRDAGVGAVIVLAQEQVCGIVTDRDIVLRVVAEERDMDRTTLGDICSHTLTTVAPTDSVEHAIDLMREKAVRRLPVVEGGRAVGMVSLGDLAIERDPNSVLGEISAALPNE